MFRAIFRPSSGALDCIYSIWYYSPMSLPAGVMAPASKRFSAPAQTGPGAHPASCTMGTGSLLGVKRPGRGVDLLPHLTSR